MGSISERGSVFVFLFVVFVNMQRPNGGRGNGLWTHHRGTSVFISMAFVGVTNNACKQLLRQQHSEDCFLVSIRNVLKAAIHILRETNCPWRTAETQRKSNSVPVTASANCRTDWKAGGSRNGLCFLYAELTV